MVFSLDATLTSLPFRSFVYRGNLSGRLLAFLFKAPANGDRTVSDLFFHQRQKSHDRTHHASDLLQRNTLTATYPSGVDQSIYVMGGPIPLS
jgi:hypothetical protein